MGCCVSTEEENRAIQKQNSSSLHKQHHQQFPFISKSPPTSDEESVKEVLSEIPNLWPKHIPEPEPGIKISNIEENPETEQLQQPTKSNLFLTPKKPLFNQNQLKSSSPTGPGRASEEISDISSTTLKEGDEDDEVLQRVYGYYQGQNGHFTIKNRAYSGRTSPVRRSDPSPNRTRNPGLRPENQVDGSGRRSRSPANRSNVGRSPSGRRTGPSPGRVRMVQGPGREIGSRKVEEESFGMRGNGNGNEWQGPNESLDNPLVSLECFIFL